jgi:hypothetical protein
MTPLDFDFDLPLILVGIISSLIGYAYFRYGKKNADIFCVACGIILMIDSYAVQSIGWLIALNAGLSLAPLIRNKL